MSKIIDLKKPNFFGPPIDGSVILDICAPLIGKPMDAWKEHDVYTVLKTILSAAHINGRDSIDNRNGAFAYADILEKLLQYGQIKNPHVLHLLDPFLVILYDNQQDQQGLLCQIQDAIAVYPHSVICHDNNPFMYQFMGSCSFNIRI